MAECGHLIGHLAPWSPHRFRDPMSGMQVNKTMFQATTIVDERGCVVEA